jgi:hypothetical protein
LRVQKGSRVNQEGLVMFPGGQVEGEQPEGLVMFPGRLVRFPEELEGPQEVVGMVSIVVDVETTALVIFFVCYHFWMLTLYVIILDDVISVIILCYHFCYNFVLSFLDVFILCYHLCYHFMLSFLDVIICVIILCYHF